MVGKARALVSAERTGKCDKGGCGVEVVVVLGGTAAVPTERQATATSTSTMANPSQWFHSIMQVM